MLIQLSERNYIIHYLSRNEYNIMNKRDVKENAWKKLEKFYFPLNALHLAS